MVMRPCSPDLYKCVPLQLILQSSIAACAVRGVPIAPEIIDPGRLHTEGDSKAHTHTTSADAKAAVEEELLNTTSTS